MDLINKTRYSAALATTIIEQHEMLASLIIKASFQLDNGILKPLKTQTWPIGQALKTELGEFDDDTPFRKQGVDVMLLGKAYPDPGSATNRTRVDLQVGSLNYAMNVFGDRHWQRHDDELVASPAEPFDAIALTWENAYGGKCPVETGDMPYHYNPAGKGFYLSEETAENGLLANIEDIDNPVRNWEDQPVPRGTAPLSRESSIRIMNSADFDENAKPPKIKLIKPSYYNNANPDLILPEPPAEGTIIKASGVRPGGEDFLFKMPAGTFHNYVQLADRSYVFPAQLDTIVLLPEQMQVMLGFRCCFRYKVIPLERRLAVLYGGEAPASVPKKYLIDWETLDESDIIDG